MAKSGQMPAADGGKSSRLPTRGGLGDGPLPRREATPDDHGSFPCNIWQGQFPQTGLCPDGCIRTAPARFFAPNGHGLFNMAGNVWKWTSQTIWAQSLKSRLRRPMRAKRASNSARTGRIRATHPVAFATALRRAVARRPTVRRCITVFGYCMHRNGRGAFRRAERDRTSCGPDQKKPNLRNSALSLKTPGGEYRNRTGVHGFAIRCVTTPPTRQPWCEGCDSSSHNRAQVCLWIKTRFGRPRALPRASGCGTSGFRILNERV